jgi:hypothetical protein
MFEKEKASYFVAMRSELIERPYQSLLCISDNQIEPNYETIFFLHDGLGIFSPNYIWVVKRARTVVDRSQLVLNDKRGNYKNEL